MRAYSTGAGSAIIARDNALKDNRWQCSRCREWNFRREWSIKNELADGDYCNECLDEWVS